MFYVLIFILLLCILSFFRNSQTTYHLLFKLLLLFVIWAVFFFMFSDFLSLLILLVYSGGIAVLFLFASFVLDTNFFFLKSFSKNNYTNLLFLFLIGFKFVTLFFQNYNNLFYISEKLNLSLFSYKIQLFSYMLYEKYPIFLIFIALILLVAMLGSIGSFNRLGISQLYVGKKSYKSVKKWFNYSDENNSKELFLLSCWKTWW